MGAYVRDLHIHRCCAECGHDLASAVGCVYTKRVVLPAQNDIFRHRHPECPILPVPMDMRLVSLDAVFTVIDCFLGYLDADMILRLKIAVCRNCLVYVDTMGGNHEEVQER